MNVFETKLAEEIKVLKAENEKLKTELSLYKEGLKEAINRPMGVVPDRTGDTWRDAFILR